MQKCKNLIHGREASTPDRGGSRDATTRRDATTLDRGSRDAKSCVSNQYGIKTVFTAPAQFFNSNSKALALQIGLKSKNLQGVLSPCRFK